MHSWCCLIPQLSITLLNLRQRDILSDMVIAIPVNRSIESCIARKFKRQPQFDCPPIPRLLISVSHFHARLVPPAILRCIIRREDGFGGIWGFSKARSVGKFNTSQQHIQTDFYGHKIEEGKKTATRRWILFWGQIPPPQTETGG